MVIQGLATPLVRHVPHLVSPALMGRCRFGFLLLELITRYLLIGAALLVDAVNRQ
ncbi:hypothetical protein D3C81_2008150 [compost metagenome]